MKGIASIGIIAIISIALVLFIGSGGKLPLGSLTDTYGGRIEGEQLTIYSQKIDYGRGQGCQQLGRGWILAVLDVPDDQVTNINIAATYAEHQTPGGRERTGISWNGPGEIRFRSSTEAKEYTAQGMIFFTSWVNGNTGRNELETCTVYYHIEFCDPAEKYNAAKQSCEPRQIFRQQTGTEVSTQPITEVPSTQPDSTIFDSIMSAIADIINYLKRLFK